MEVIKGCIFDLDGVIVDTAKYHYLAWKRLAEELGYHLTEVENEQLKGVSRLKSLDIIIQLAGLSVTQAERSLLAEKKNLWFNEYIAIMSPSEIFPGVKALLATLRTQGMKIGLASSSKNAGTVIKVLDIEEEFDTIVDGNMISQTKPHPEIFLKTAYNLGLEPANCVVIEDAEAGVEAAIAAGMKCIGIGSPELLKGADKVFSTTAEVDLPTLRSLERHTSKRL